MPKINCADIRKRKSTTLRQLGTILNRHKICADISPIESAAQQCLSHFPYGRDSWGYNISNLVFRLDNPSGISLRGAKEFRIELSVVAKGDCDPDESDRFRHLEIDLEKFIQNANDEELKTAWHFDRHIGDDRGKEVHPLYHFQYGGKKLEEINGSLGATFLLDPPRLMHPPMDGILAVDFVLSNYAGEVWRDLRLDGEYINIVNGAFEDIWKPYFEAVTSNWSFPKRDKHNLFCPQLHS